LTDPAQTQAQQVRGRLWQTAWRALPGRRVAIAGAVLWAAVMGVSALFTLLSYNWETPDRIRFVILIFAAGGALAFPVGLYLARLVSVRRGPEVAFAAAFVALLVTTVAFTSTIYAFQYRFYYAEWHAPTLSFTWARQFAVTTAVALYQFATLGLRLYFPVGFAALFIAGLWFARQPR